MKLHFFLVLFFILTSTYGICNMASPVRKGSAVSNAFTSRNIEIKKEKILIFTDKDFQKARFQIEYFIYSGSDEAKIPLLFHASGYSGDFKVRLDSYELDITEIPGEYLNNEGFPYNDLKDNFISDSSDENSGKVYIKWSEESGSYYSLNDLKYFETSVSKGEHRIIIEYTADAWSDRSDWIKEFYFIYSLSPAKHWKTFDSLEVVLKPENPEAVFTTNLGNPSEKYGNSVYVWKFAGLPSDIIKIDYIPEVSLFSILLLYFEPFGLTLIFTGIITFVHFLLIRSYRKNNPGKKHSPVLIAGIFLIPLFILILYVYSFELIDSFIGIYAGRYHGYTFLIILLYPVILIVYGIVMWISDKIFKRKFCAEIELK